MESISFKLSDPSQSVEVRQLSFLLKSALISYQQGKIDNELYNNLLAFCKGFKNIELVGSIGEHMRFSDEFFENEGFKQGDDAVIKTPPIIWKFGGKLRVIVKGSASHV
jgi:hypothetical protein